MGVYAEEVVRVGAFPASVCFAEIRPCRGHRYASLSSAARQPRLSHKSYTGSQADFAWGRRAAHSERAKLRPWIERATYHLARWNGPMTHPASWSRRSRWRGPAGRWSSTARAPDAKSGARRAIAVTS